MATRKTTSVDIEQISNAIGAVNAAVIDTDEEPAPARPTAVRLNPQEYDYLKRIFETKGKGLKVSTGMKMAALWIADQVEAGAMSISKAGIIDRR
ncbi:hypothetical protein FACS1894164_14150 [Spirochaetia bacterium]|nr:hypothetical protein FACS1894164_14150 [Spirochaetia bacterium]